MKWYLTKLVYRIICGSGEHTPQFDEQLRLIAASNGAEAFEKARHMGMKEEDVFYNSRHQLVRWQFVDVSELYHLTELIDGAELYSRVNEVDDAETYANFVHGKADSIRDNQSRHMLNLI